MRKTTFLLLLLGAMISAGVFELKAQKRIVCGDKKITIDEKDTFVFDARKTPWNSNLNGKALYFPKPVYPKEAARQKLRGVVAVNVTVNVTGEVVSASAVSGSVLLRPAAVEAARRAKFKKLLVNCEPQEYTGTVIYNFTNRTESAGDRSAEAENSVSLGYLGDVTPDAVYLPAPRVPFNVRFPPNEIVKVTVIIDFSSGRVASAQAFSGSKALYAYAEEAALCARFPVPADFDGKASGYLQYKFTDANKSSLTQANGGILNGKAISLPPPVLPPDTEFSGSIGVRVELDEEGNVTAAKAVSGKICLGEAAVEAARKAKFTKTYLSGVPVRISGIVVYHFPARNK